MVTVKVNGQLAIRTIHGVNGDFSVGRLVTDIGEFVVKDVELDQYKEGKYDGEFVIRRISPYSYNSNGRFVIEVRALLGGMVLSGIDALTQSDANAMVTHEVDPADEETPKQSPLVATGNPLQDTAPFGEDVPVKPKRVNKPATQAFSEQPSDEDLFGIIWPLGEVVKLDATVNRKVYRQQIARLNELGYTFDEKSQLWNMVKH